MQLGGGVERTMMVPSKTDLLPISSSTDVVLIRQKVRTWAVELGFSLVDQTKMITAASELARNSLDYGGGGTVRFETVENGVKRGLRLTFEDQGPGIPDIDLALTDGYTTGKGMGLGLGGAKRLVNTFEIASRPGEGTRVTITRWK
jgi:serine/threonine-protein kinase RsbT